MTAEAEACDMVHAVGEVKGTFPSIFALRVVEKIQ